jgi:hypothetical protein
VSCILVLACVLVPNLFLDRFLSLRGFQASR